MKRNLFIILFLSWMVGASIGMTAAQDVTPVVTESVTATPAPQVTEQPPITVPSEPGGTLIIGWNAFTNFVGIIIALGTAGFVLSLATIITVVKMVRQDKTIESFGQKLFMSQPAQLRETEKQILDLGTEVVGLAKDITSTDTGTVG